MKIRGRTLFEHQDSAALGKSAPVHRVPVGFMVLATCPLILWLLEGTVAGVASALLVIALFSVALLFLSIGQKNHAAYDAKEIAYRPRIPFKLLGSALVGLVVGLLAAAKISVAAIPALFGLVAFILCLLAFGLDPLRHKGLDTPTARLRLENRRMRESYELRCEAMIERVAALGDEDLTARTRTAMDTIFELLVSVDLESGDLQRMAKPLDKVLTKIETEIGVLAEDLARGPAPFQRRIFLSKLVALIEAFESRAHRHGIGVGRDRFELQADLLFDRMRRAPGS